MPCSLGAVTQLSIDVSSHQGSRYGTASREFNGRMRNELLASPCSSISMTPEQDRMPLAYVAHLIATDDRMRNADQLRRSPVAPPPHVLQTTRL